MSTESTTAPAVETAAPIATPVAAPAKAAGFAPLGASPVVAVKPEGANSVIRMYEGKDTGYIVLQQSVLDFSNPMWPKEKKRSTLMKGKKDLLQMIVNNLVDKKTLAMPGKLIVEEVLYDEAFRNEMDAVREKAPAIDKRLNDFVRTLNLTAEDEDAILKDVLKKAGKDGPILTRLVGDEDQWILKFTRYQNKPNADGNYDQDVLIQHTNQEEIADYRAEHPQGGAGDDQE